MALREVVREGPTATGEFETIEHQRKSLPMLDNAELKASPDFKQENGWVVWKDLEKSSIDFQRWVADKDYDVLERELNEVRSIYFDAIELQEQFLRLV